MKEADQRCYMCNCSGREKGVVYVPCMWTCTLHRTMRIDILFCIYLSINYQPVCGCVHELSPLAWHWSCVLK